MILTYRMSCGRIFFIVKLFYAIFKFIEKIEVGILIFCISGMASLSVLNVISRTFFSHTFAFVEELNQFLIIALTFIGTGYATSQARHIRMSAIYDAFPPKGRKAIMLLISATTAGLCFLLAWYGWQYVETVRELGTRSPVLQWPYWWVYLLAPLGFVTTGIQYLLTLVRNTMSPEVYLSFEHQEEIPEEPVLVE